VGIGEEVTFDVFVTFEGADYALNDIAEVKYLLFDATGEIAKVDVAEAVDDGYFTITLSAETTGALAAGANKLEVVVVVKPVSIPSISALEFVTE